MKGVKSASPIKAMSEKNCRLKVVQKNTVERLYNKKYSTI
jgi:hypothetical protein